MLCLGHDEASVHGGGPGHVPTSCSRVCIKQTIQIYLGVGGKRLLGLHRHHEEKGQMRGEGGPKEEANKGRGKRELEKR